jgi:uncharacterized protein (DUF433 family)
MLAGTRDRGSELIAMPQHVLSFGEAVVLADVRGSGDTIRKDIETGILPRDQIIRRFEDRRLGFAWNYVFTLAAVYGNESMGKDLRKIALMRVCEVTQKSDACWMFATHYPPPVTPFACTNVIEISGCMSVATARIAADNALLKVDVGKFLKIDLGEVCADVKPRVSVYAEGLAKTEKKTDVMGGERVFRGTRLPVRHIGGMVENGESVHNIRDDYPNLTETDVKFAHLYYLAHPPLGRPRKSGETDLVVTDAG